MKHLLKNFKKISSDEKSTTFKHKDGHEIKIAKKALSGVMKKQLDALPHFDDGGEVKPANYGYDLYNDNESGAESGRTEDRSPASVPTEAEAGSHAPSYDAKAETTNVGPYSVPVSSNTPAMASTDGSPNNVGPYNINASPPPVSTEGKKEQQYSGPATTKTPEQPGMMDKYAQSYMGGVGEQKSGIQGQAGVQQGSEAEMSGALGNMSQYEHGQTGGYGDILQDTQKKAFARRDEFKQDVVNHHVDSNHIFKDMGTGSKIATGIGLLLSGMGSAVTGQPNLAYDFLMKQRDADIAAQEKNLSSYQGLYHDNLQDFGNRMDALNMTKINMNDALSHKMASIAASSNSQNAQNIAQQTIGQLDKESAFLSSQIGQTNGGGIEGTLNALRYINPKMAENLEGRYVPGVGVASVNVPEADRKEIRTRQDLDNKINDLRQFSQQNEGNLNPAVINAGKAKANLVQDAYRQAAGQGVFKPAEKEFVSGIINDDPTAFFNKFRVDPGYKAIEESNRGSLHSLYSNYGLKPQGQAQGQGQITSFKPKQ